MRFRLQATIIVTEASSVQSKLIRVSVARMHVKESLIVICASHYGLKMMVSTAKCTKRS